jgi:hypothetical protein
MIRFAVLGAAAALAVSAKYIGALVVPFAFVPAFQLREKGCHRVLILSAALFAVLLVINFPIFASLDSFLGGLGREVDFVLHGHKGLTIAYDFRRVASGRGILSFGFCWASTMSGSSRLAAASIRRNGC